LTELLNLKQA